MWANNWTNINNILTFARWELDEKVDTSLICLLPGARCKMGTLWWHILFFVQIQTKQDMTCLAVSFRGARRRDFLL